MKIHPKVIAMGSATALIGIAAWALKTYAHVSIPLDTQAEFATVIVLISGWLAPDTNNGSQ